MKKYSMIVLLLAFVGFVALDVCDKAVAQTGTARTDFPEFIQPERTIILRSLVSGQVQAVNFEAQDYVQQNQEIIKMDDELLRIRVENIKTSLELNTYIQKAQIRLNYAQDNLNIVQQLYDRKVGDTRVGSAKELKEAQQSYDLSLQELNDARLEVKKLEFTLRELNKNLTFHTITAPVSGVIVPFNMVKQLEQENVKAVEVGEVVLERQALVALMKVDHLRIRASESAQNYEEIHIGQPALVFVMQDGPQAKPIEGKVVYKSPMINAAIGRFDFEVEFKNPALAEAQGSQYPFVYRPGTRARIELKKTATDNN